MSQTINKTDTLDIKEWAKEKDKEHRSTINYYIKEGINKKQAVEMVLKDSVLGQGYKAQIIHDYIGFQIPAVLEI